MSDQLSIPQEQPSVALMLQGALSNIQSQQITTQHVDVLSQLMSLYERNEKREAEKAFAEALVALQGEAVSIVATKKVDEKPDGSCRYKFAPYEEIMRKVQPMLTKHGFSITFDTKIGEERLTSICTLTHKSGHSRSNEFAVRFGKPPGSSEAQGDMSTKSYAKRGALCDALNITIEKDDDGRMEGGNISQEQADSLRKRVAALGVDEARFLSTAQAAQYEAITQGKYGALDDLLTRRERKAAK